MKTHLIYIGIFVSIMSLSCAKTTAPSQPPLDVLVLGDRTKTPDSEKQVSLSEFKSERARSLNFQRLLAQEERRTGALDAQLKRMEEELKSLREQCKIP